MNFRRLLNTPTGRNIVSILLGIGLATIFRRACTDKNCIVFNGPIISEVEGKTFKHGDKCYKYSTVSEKCDPMKRVVDIREKSEEEADAKLF
uniref:Uncharacterized protein n=1 Tax=viral metagenome TaxID=1070528 RepID=A0A6C0ASE7_9ZZZZ